MATPVASHIWLDGRLVPSDGPHISVYDRGFQIGDGVFEALRARRGVAIELGGHLARLRRSLRALDIQLDLSDETLTGGMADLLAAEGWDGIEPAGDAAVRITVSRGPQASRGLIPSAGVAATTVIQAWPHTPPAPEVVGAGQRFIFSAVRRDPSSPMAGVKTTSRAELVYARIEAQKAGADDAIFLTADGRVTEATTANILLIRGDVCATPRLEAGILEGTTRAWLVGHGDAVGLRMVEEDIRPTDLMAADEVASCSSVAGVMPIVSLDGKPIGGGKPGLRTMAMREARERWIDAVSIDGTHARLPGA
jgi:branched-chain amino acid aminotransferase